MMIAIVVHILGKVNLNWFSIGADFTCCGDRAAKRLGTTRSGFTREALRSALRKVHIAELERKHREGYRRKPIKRGEFSDWESEQVWVE